MSEKLEKVIKISVLSVMVFLIAIAGFSYAYFNPTVQGNEQASSNRVTTKPIVHPLYTVMEELATAGTYASTYSGNDSNDSYGVAAAKPIYYIRTSTADDETQAATLLNKINVKFAGYCWQMFRTTDTGGVKLIYNGDPDSNGYCLQQDTSTTHKGVLGASGAVSTVYNADYMFSDNFTYNTSTNQFTLVNPIVSNWATNKNLIGKYTCKTDSTTSTCTTLYYLNSEDKTDSTKVQNTRYTIANVSNSYIGTSAINANPWSPAYVGYMFGDTQYEVGATEAITTGSIMGSEVTWNGSNYVLKDSSNNVSTHKFAGTYENNYHYTCNTTSATCTDGKVRFYFAIDYYIELENGDSIETALSKMLTNVENKHDSAMKAYLENWYNNELKSYESYLDKRAVYCNDRSVTAYNGWSEIGNLVAYNNTNSRLNFKNSTASIESLECTNNTDKFSVYNPSAHLNYPIGLAAPAELKLINNSYVRKTGSIFYTSSPRIVAYAGVYYRVLGANGATNASASGVNSSYGVRPVIVLKPTTATITGNGSFTSPYVIN